MNILGSIDSVEGAEAIACVSSFDIHDMCSGGRPQYMRFYDKINALPGSLTLHIKTTHLHDDWFLRA